MTAPYIIVGEDGPPMERKSHMRPNAIQAVSLAVQLTQVGFKSVRIIDANGRIYHQPEFELLVPLPEKKTG
jgi:hypothetical protein